MAPQLYSATLRNRGVGIEYSKEPFLAPAKVLRTQEREKLVIFAVWWMQVGRPAEPKMWAVWAVWLGQTAPATKRQGFNTKPTKSSLFQPSQGLPERGGPLVWLDGWPTQPFS